MVMCNKIIDTKETKAIPKNIIYETKCFYNFLGFLFIIKALLVAFSINLCLNF